MPTCTTSNTALFPKIIRTNIDKLKNDIVSLEAKLLAMDTGNKCKCHHNRNNGKPCDKAMQTSARIHKDSGGKTTQNANESLTSNRTKGSTEDKRATPRNQDCPCGQATKMNGCCDCNCLAKHKKPPFYLGTINRFPTELPLTHFGTLTTERRSTVRGREKTVHKTTTKPSPCNISKDCPFTGKDRKDCPCGTVTSHPAKQRVEESSKPCRDCPQCPFTQKGDQCPCATKKMDRPMNAEKDKNIIRTTHKENNCQCTKEVTVKSIVYDGPGDCPIAKQSTKENAPLSARNQPIDHYHHQICIPLDILQSPKSKSKDIRPTMEKSEDGNSTWREIFTKKPDPKKPKGCKCSSKPKQLDKSSKLQSSYKSKDAERILNKELEVKNLALRNMQQLLEKHEKGGAALASLVTNLQDEVEVLQEGHGKAKLENHLRALEEEKLKVLLNGKDIILENVLRCNDVLDEKLRRQREFERNAAGGPGIEKILLGLRPQMADLTTTSLGRSHAIQRDIHPPQTSTPTGSAESLDGFANESWKDLSRIEHRS